MVGPTTPDQCGQNTVLGRGQVFIIGHHNIIAIAGTTAYNISLNHEVYANNSMVDISEIGSTTPNDHNLTALACVTAWRPCCKANRTGQWYFPNGTTVPIQGTGPERATHFYRNRDDNGTVNLNRVNEEVVSPTGIFCCVVPDATGEDTQLCVDIGG